MSQQLRHILFFLFAGFLTYSVWKYYFDREPEVQDKPFTKGYSVENLELQVTDENGDFVAKFVSPNLMRYTDSDTVHVEKPRMYAYSNQQESWQFDSLKADYDHKRNTVKMMQDVSVKQLNSAKQIQLKFQNLLVDLHEKKAETDSGVELEKETFNMVGERAWFDFINEKIEVKGNVKVVYKTPSELLAH